MNPIRLGLAGCGQGPLQIHLPILARARGVEMVAIAEPDAGRAAAARSIVPHARTMPDYRALVTRAELDAVVVSLPTAMHADAAVMAFDAGKHVYLEKPIATDEAGAAAVLRAWQHAGTVGMVGFNYRFNRLYRSAADALTAGRIGRVVAARSVFSIARSELPQWKRFRTSGGGALLDLAAHHVDLAGFLLGSPITDVFARIRSVHTEHDTVQLQLCLADGPVVDGLFCLSAVDEERFEVFGDGGCLIVDRSRHQNAVLCQPRRRGRRTAAVRTALRDACAFRYVLEKRRTPGHEPSHRIALERFLDAVRHGYSATPDIRDGYRNVQVLAAAERSALTGRIEQVTPS